MKIFLVYAHPEPQSFNGTMKEQAGVVLNRAGHEVRVSDLYDSDFKARADRQDFLSPSRRDYFKLQTEQAHAYKTRTLAADILAEQEKIQWCDALIVQFPLWWSGMPAILKGWVDRVFTTGFAYSNGKWYDKGPLRGRRAMLAVTTGGKPGMYSPRGLHGDINQLLYPINHGILYFSGFTVLPPFVAYGPSRADDITRHAYLEQYKQRLLALETTEPIRYPALADYDENYELKP